MTAALLQSVFADNEQAASRFVEYWNMGEGRDVRNESVFSKDFIDRRGPDGLAMMMNMVYGDNGEISIHSITENSDQRIVFAASAQKGNWMEIALDVSADFRVAGMSIQLVPQPPEGTDKGLSEAQIVSKLEQYLGKRAAAGDFSGSVLLARKGDILFAQAYGLADREKGLENTLDTPINLGYIGSPAGGGYASANDLLRFATALYDGSLIDGQHREEMTTYKIQQGSDEGYAYLYGDARVNGRRYIGHNGGAPGINAEFSVFPDSGYTLVVLSNTGSNASPVANQVRQWIGFQQRVERTRKG